MKQVFAFVVVACLSACALPGHADLPLAERAALDFSGKAASDMGENTAFSRSVAARYGNGLSRDDILADVQAQGFSCDADETSCTRTKVVEACAEAWIVDLDEAGAASGRHILRCMGALADDE